MCVVIGCRSGNFQPRPEDEIIKLDQPGETPKSKGGNFQAGDPVVLIKNNGSLSFDHIDSSADDLVLVRIREDLTKWLPAEKPYYNSQLNSYDEKKVEKTVPKGYRFAYGGRGEFYEWYPAEQVFTVPWANNVNLKVGDAVHKLDGSFARAKAVVSEIPVNRFGKFRVRFGDNQNSAEIDAGEIFSSIEPAKPEDLSPGDIVRFDNKGWAMIIGKRDGKIIIREGDLSPKDELVPVSKLWIAR